MSAELRAARDALVADRSLGGVEFGRALADLLDDAFADAFAAAGAALGSKGGWALLALGSYARRELCPGSDVDVMLLHVGGRHTPSRDDAGAIWYPFWDAGFVLGHATRTVREASALADHDLDALTSLIDTRFLAGDVTLAQELATRMQALVPRRRDRLIEDLATHAAARFDRPGPISEMLAPNLKDGAGGLRDVQAPGWVGHALGVDIGDSSIDVDPRTRGDGWKLGVDALVRQGYLHAPDVAQLANARDRLLDARIALHRVRVGRSDDLNLQDQDDVAKLVGAADADVLVRELGAAARSVVWITGDMWERLRSTQRGPGGRGSGVRQVDAHVVVRDGRAALANGDLVDATAALALVARAAEQELPFDREALDRLATLPSVEWTPEARDDFIALLRTGRPAVKAFETLDHVGLLVRLLPEWENVRARPQRNAYHRFTVDRHSLEAVVVCAALLDPAHDLGSGFDGDVARRSRVDVLLLSVLLHDVGKGGAGDHSVAGVDIARSVAQRIGLDAEGTDQLAWLVRHHLMLADTATRRDLGDERTIERFASEVGDAARLDLLYALTLADSLATGPTAWNRTKAALVRELFVKAHRMLFSGEGVLAEDSTAQLLDHYAPLLGARGVTVEWFTVDDDTLRVVVVAPDRTGMLARVSGALSVLGFDIATASAISDGTGMAIERFTGQHRFGRLADAGERDRATNVIVAALRDDVRLDDELRERARRYQKPVVRAGQREVAVEFDLCASDVATVVEVHAPDDVGVLARVAAAFADLELDVTMAIASTIGDRVLDVFYLRDATGAKIVDHATLESVRATVLARLAEAVALD